MRQKYVCRQKNAGRRRSIRYKADPRFRRSIHLTQFEQGSPASFHLLDGARIWTLAMKLSAYSMPMGDSVHMQKYLGRSNNQRAHKHLFQQKLIR